MAMSFRLSRESNMVSENWDTDTTVELKHERLKRRLTSTPKCGKEQTHREFYFILFIDVLCVPMHTHAYECACRGQTTASRICSYLAWDKVSLLTSAHAKLVGPHTFGDSSLPPPSPCRRPWLQMCAWNSMGSRNSNSVLQACVAASLSTEPPWPAKCLSKIILKW